MNISGVWNTNRLPIKFYQHGNKVLGAFELNDALFEGTIKGNVLTGTWMHPHKPIYGPCNYGTIKFVFNENSFIGYATYCDTNIPSDVIWRGYRKKD